MSCTLSVLRTESQYAVHLLRDDHARDPTAPFALELAASIQDVQAQLDQLSQLLTSLASRRTAPLAAQASASGDPLVALGRLLYNRLMPAPIRSALSALPEGSPLTIVTNQTEVLWELLHDGDDFLCLKYELSRQLLTGSFRSPTVAPPHLWSTLFIGNPTEDLNEAGAETEQLVRLVRGTPNTAIPRVLMQARATKSAVLQQLASGVYDLIHYSGHTVFDSADPSRTGILLAGGEVLSLGEIEQNLAGKPYVFLNSCESARGSAASLGHLAAQDVVAAFVRGGAAGALGTFWPINDAASLDFALIFYRSILGGERVGAALRHARLAAKTSSQTSLWAAYIHYGDPNLTVLATHRTQKRTAALLCVRLSAHSSISEQAAELHHDILDLIAVNVDHLGGRVLSAANESVLAGFGIEGGRHDDAERALRTALAIQQGVQEIGRGTAANTLAVEVGVSSGDILVYRLGTANSTTFAVSGTTVDDAANLARKAPPNTIVVSDTVRRLTQPFFVFAGPNPIPSGSDAPSFAYQVVRTRSHSETVWDVLGHQTELVGRQGQLLDLQRLWSVVQKGSCQLVEIVGDAGIGKSRLLVEFRRQLAALDADWITVNCPSAYSPAPYWLVSQVVRALLGLPQEAWGDATEVSLEQVLASQLGLSVDSPELSEQQAILAELLGRAPETGGLIPRDAKTGQRRLVAFLRQLLVRQCARHPVLVVIENLPWSDQASIEVLNALLPGIESIRAMILATARPHEGWFPPWQNRRNRTQLRIDPLEDTESMELARNLLPGAPIGEDIAAVVLLAANGNPLFERELLTTLQEAVALSVHDGTWRLVRQLEHVDVPNTIQRVIHTRVQALPQDAQQLLMLMSVIGDKCDFRILQALTHVSEHAAMRSCLELLESRGLIFHSWDDDSYTFAHNLFRQEVYQSLVGEERRRLHYRIGLVLEQVYAGHEASVLDLLAHHFYSAVLLPEGSGEPLNFGETMERVDLQRAAGYLLQAGDQARRRYAARQAILCYQRGLQLAQVLDDPPAHYVASCYAGMGDAYDLVGEFSLAIESYDKALNASGPPFADAQERRTAADTARRNGRVAGKMGLYKDGHRAMRRALQLLGRPQNAEDHSVAGLIQSNIGSLHFWEGNVHQAEKHCRAALKLSEAADQDSVTATICNVLGVVCEVTGRWGEALTLFQRSRDLWTQVGDRHQLALVNDNFGTLCFYRGDFTQAEAIYLQNLAFWKELNATDEIGYVSLNLGGVHLVRGELDAADRLYSQAAAIFKQTKNAKQLALTHNNQGFLALARCQAEAARYLFADSIAIDASAESYRGMAEAETALGDLDAALADAEKSLALTRSDGLSFEEGVTLRVLGEIQALCGNEAGALESLRLSLTILDSLGAEFEAGRTRLALHNGPTSHTRG